MRPIRLLIVEGNTAPARDAHAAVWGTTPSQSYADVLRGIEPAVQADVCFPADSGANLPDPAGITGYDGVVLTGSSLNIWKQEPESMRQVELARAVYEAGVPFFGSCWGLQVGTVAAGGDVRLNPKGREVGIARKIRLTEAGRGHDLHAGRDEVFDAPAVHYDEVATRPDGMLVTATNAVSDVQAAEIRHGNGVFWGVQYHPEFSLAELAAIIDRSEPALIRDGFFKDQAAIDSFIADLKALDADPAGRRDLAWRYGLDASVTDAARRTTELSNFLIRRVLATMSARGRA